jgi:hypothetical protein
VLKTANMAIATDEPASNAPTFFIPVLRRSKFFVIPRPPLAYSGPQGAVRQKTYGAALSATLREARAYSIRRRSRARRRLST